MSNDEDILFNKMKKTSFKDNKDNSKETSKETFKENTKDKEKDKEDEDINKIKKFGMNYYKILGVKKDASAEDIKKRYRHLLAKYHPDKLKGLNEKEIKQKKENYTLIRIAGEILSNQEKKSYYDLEQKVLKNKDFAVQKQNFEDFIKLQTSEITEEKKKTARIDYMKDVEYLNKKAGYDPEQAKNVLTKQETDQRYEDLIASRDLDRIEALKPDPFAGRAFNPVEFNKMFEKDKKKRDKKEHILQSNGQLTKYNEGFTAFNDDTTGTSFVNVNFDEDVPYEDLYVEDNFGGSTAFGKIDKSYEFSDGEISVSSEEYEDYDLHNKNKEKTNISYEELLKLRKEEDKLYNSMKYKDFKDATHDQFGISKDFGVMVGNDVTGKTSGTKIDKNLVRIYNRLLEK